MSENPIIPDNQPALRRNGSLPIISIEADNLAQATYESILQCYNKGARVETPKHQKGGSLGYDGIFMIKVNHPNSEPKICYPGMSEDARGIVQYILEVTHGIHNHWKKDPNDPNDYRWGYTYNERFVDQLPFVFQRIKKDWDERRRITGRDYQFTTWRAGEDIILEQNDPPCFQNGQLRFLENDAGQIILNYLTYWRSRDDLKAWNENNIAQVELQKLLAAKISNLLGIPIGIGPYIDICGSLHLYGFYKDRDKLDKTIERMKKNPYQKLSIGLDDYFLNQTGKDKKGLMRIVAAQSDAELKGHGLNVPEKGLIELGYNLETFEYPEEWNSWPKSWDAQPDISKLARVF